MVDKQDFSEDDGILAQLTDPLDVEAFSNIMENAHTQGRSAASMIREEPKITSRERIRKLCLKDRKKVFSERVKDFFRAFGRGVPRGTSDRADVHWEPPKG
jgi:hypothetical protein